MKDNTETPRLIPENSPQRLLPVGGAAPIIECERQAAIHVPASPLPRPRDERAQSAFTVLQSIPPEI